MHVAQSPALRKTKQNKNVSINTNIEIHLNPQALTLEFGYISQFLNTFFFFFCKASE
jgi:hypothetical protein